MGIVYDRLCPFMAKHVLTCLYCMLYTLFLSKYFVRPDVASSQLWLDTPFEL